MAELFGEHTINEELTPAVPAMSAAVDTRRVVDRRDVCRTCGKVNKHVDRHCANVHLPWWVVYKTACFRCGKQEGTTGALRKGHQGHGGYHAREELDVEHQKLWVTWAAAFLRMLVRELGLPSLSSLKQLVEEEGYLPHVEPADVPLTQELQLRLCVELGERYPTEGCRFRPPNTISALMNWETICASGTPATTSQELDSQVPSGEGSYSYGNGCFGQATSPAPTSFDQSGKGCYGRASNQATNQASTYSDQFGKGCYGRASNLKDG